MKIFKRIFVSATIAVSLLSFAADSNAQSAGLNPLIQGSTYRLLANSTNVVAQGLSSTNTYGLPGTSSNLIVNVSEYDKVGFTWSYTAGSNVTARIFKSYDNAQTFELVPSYTYSSPAASSSAFQTNALLDVTGCTHVGLTFGNASTIDATNLWAAFNLKSPRYGSKIVPY